MDRFAPVAFTSFTNDEVAVGVSRSLLKTRLGDQKESERHLAFKRRCRAFTSPINGKRPSVTKLSEYRYRNPHETVRIVVCPRLRAGGLPDSRVLLPES
jgi:hypothetical protein